MLSGKNFRVLGQESPCRFDVVRVLDRTGCGFVRVIRGRDVGMAQSVWVSGFTMVTVVAHHLVAFETQKRPTLAPVRLAHNRDFLSIALAHDQCLWYSPCLQLWGMTEDRVTSESPILAVRWPTDVTLPMYPVHPAEKDDNVGPGSRFLGLYRSRNCRGSLLGSTLKSDIQSFS